MTTGTHVHLSKQGTEHPGYLPDDYWLEGEVLSDIRVGATICVARSRRARQHPSEPETVECAGLYVSSPVRQLLPQADGSTLAVTQNSSWLIRQIPVPAVATEAV